MIPYYKSPSTYYDIDPKEQANVLLDSSKASQVIPDVIGWDYDTKSKVDIIDSIWDDSGLETWAKRMTPSVGSSMHIWNLIKTPTYNVELLKRRQKAIKNFPDNISLTLDELLTYEKDIAWLFTMPPMKDAHPINVLFPTIPVVHLLNKIPFVLTSFHLYRIFIMPIMNVLTPLITFFSPWLYLRRTLKLKISFRTYVNAIWKGIVLGLNTGGKAGIKYLTFLVYAILYLYSLIHSVDTAYLLYRIRNNLYKKINNIKAFIKKSEAIINSIDADNIIGPLSSNFNKRKPLKLERGLSGLYTILTCKLSQGMLLSLLRAVYTLDIARKLKGLLVSKQCCLVEYDDTASTRIYNMGHVTLESNQVRNPVDLSKSIVVTGPNAAGKTTYVKSICTNIILAQTFGIACGLKARINPVHAIGSFMRISDELGNSSLFEAEIARCSELIKQANEISANGKKALYFLDEPMHSTPPIEGSVTSYAVIEHIGKLPGIKLLVTTHYHDLVDLEKNSDIFMNLSMEAIPILTANAVIPATPISDNDSDIETNTKKQIPKYTFPYLIKRGFSTQCIALELLKDNDLPDIIVERAIEIKNKIYPNIINDRR